MPRYNFLDEAGLKKYHQLAGYSEIPITAITNYTFGKLNTDTYSHNWDAIAYGNGKFVAISNDAIKYSTDGIIWEIIDNPVTTSATWDITFGDGKFVAISSFNARSMRI